MFVILLLLQCGSYIHFDLYILELIYGNTVMLAFDFIYIAINAYRCGFIHSTLDFLYEEVYYWRRFLYYVRKIQKAMMTSWDKMFLLDFEKAWEVSKKSRYRKSRIRNHSSYYYKTYRYRNASTFMPTIACKGLSGRKRLTVLHSVASTTRD